VIPEHPRGPQLNRLHGAVDTAAPTVIDDNGVRQWLHGEQLLRNVSAAMTLAAEKGRLVGGRTGPALAEALLRSAEDIDRRADEMRLGAEALNDASVALATAQARALLLEQNVPLPEAVPPYQPPLDPDVDTVAHQADHDTKERLYREVFDSREAQAQQIADDLDARLALATDVMRALHGELTSPEVEEEREEGDDRGPVGPVRRGGATALTGEETQAVVGGVTITDVREVGDTGPSFSPAVLGGVGVAGGLAAGAGLARPGVEGGPRGGFGIPGTVHGNQGATPLGASHRTGAAGTLGRAGISGAVGDSVAAVRGGRRPRDDHPALDDDGWLDDEGVSSAVLG
jgi:hypothetical protein